MPKMINVREAFLNQPALISEEGFRTVTMDQNLIEDQSPEARAEVECFVRGITTEKPYRFSAGIATIPVEGTLLNRLSFSGWGITGYDFIRSRFDAAMMDPDVQGIMLDINSPGGQAAGAFELAEHIYNNRGTKPVKASVNSLAASAAYMIASAASHISLTPSGDAGSIGVVMTHVDASKALDNAGLKYTFIHAGKHKVDGNPTVPLTDAVAKRFQASVDRAYQDFVGLVARNRGLSEQAVRDTEAAVFNADESLSLKLVDAIADSQASYSAFVAELSGEKQEDAMSLKSGNQVAGSQAANSVTEAELETMKQGAFAEGADAERARFMSVMESEHFAANIDTAILMLGNAKLSSDEIVGLLAKMPKQQKEEQQAVATDSFKQVMDSSDHPNVGEDMKAGDEKEDKVSRLLGAHAAWTGRKYN